MIIRFQDLQDPALYGAGNWWKAIPDNSLSCGGGRWL